jgi:hypothetical protein
VADLFVAPAFLLVRRFSSPRPPGRNKILKKVLLHPQIKLIVSKDTFQKAASIDSRQHHRQRILNCITPCKASLSTGKNAASKWLLAAGRYAISGSK